MGLELVGDGLQLAERSRHRLFHRRLAAALALAHQPGDRLRRADAGDDVFALRVHEELAVKDLLSGRGIAGECDAGRTGLAPIAEHHRLDGDGRAPILRNVVQLPVGVGARRLPRAEHGADRAPQLLADILGKRAAELFFHPVLEHPGDALEVVGIELGVEVDALALLLRVENLLEQRMLHAEHDVGIHLDKPAIGVVGEARIVRELRKALRRGRVEAEIENGVHHARHRHARARAHRDEQRTRRVAERAVGGLANGSQRRFDGRLQVGGIGLAVGVIVGADLRRDRQARRHRQAETAHLGEIGAFAAEEVLHPRLALGRAAAEAVDPFRHDAGPFDWC